MMADAAQTVQAANEDQIKAMVATPVVQADVEKAAAKKEQFTKVTLERRDEAIESLARVLAIGGGSAAADTKKMLDALYHRSNGPSTAKISSSPKRRRNSASHTHLLQPPRNN